MEEGVKLVVTLSHWTVPAGIACEPVPVCSVWAEQGARVRPGPPGADHGSQRLRHLTRKGWPGGRCPFSLLFSQGGSGLCRRFVLKGTEGQRHWLQQWQGECGWDWQSGQGPGHPGAHSLHPLPLQFHSGMGDRQRNKVALQIPL